MCVLLLSRPYGNKLPRATVYIRRSDSDQGAVFNDSDYGSPLAWTLRISSGVSKGIDKSVVQGGRDFPYIRVGGGQ